MKNRQSGFTLLEILLVVGIIAVLAGIVIIALNPGKSLAKTRDLQRKVGITEIGKALTQYYIDNGQYPASLDTTSIKSICPTGVGTTSFGINCMGMVDLSALVPAYLPAIPADPTGVGYKVGVNHSHRRVVLIANLTETSPTPIAIGTTTSPLDTSSTITTGTGTVSDPYQISNWNQLNHVRDDLTKNYILMSSLSASTLGYSGIGNNWTPIGNGVSDFSGSFNGNGNTISDLIVNLPARDFVGLFGSMKIGSSIYDLRLLNVNLTGYKYVGGLVGYNEKGTISNCASGGVVRGGYEVGGLLGRNYGGTISHSFSSANIVGTVFNVQAATFLGGFVGNNYGANTGSPISQILNCYSTGSVTAYDSSKNGIGGFGNNFNAYSFITNSYSTGNVSGSPTVGGFLGYNAGTVTTSYWDKTTSGQTTSAGGVGTTTDIMKTASFYNSWDSNIWNIFNGNYPTLK